MGETLYVGVIRYPAIVPPSFMKNSLTVYFYRNMRGRQPCIDMTVLYLHGASSQINQYRRLVCLSFSDFACCQEVFRNAWYPIDAIFASNEFVMYCLSKSSCQVSSLRGIKIVWKEIIVQIFKNENKKLTIIISTFNRYVTLNLTFFRPRSLLCNGLQRSLLAPSYRYVTNLRHFCKKLHPRSLTKFLICLWYTNV